MNQSGKKRSTNTKEPGTTQISSAPEKSVAKRADVNASDSKIEIKPSRDAGFYVFHYNGEETKVLLDVEMMIDFIATQTYWSNKEDVFAELAQILAYEVNYERTGCIGDPIITPDDLLSVRIQLSDIYERERPNYIGTLNK